MENKGKISFKPGNMLYPLPAVMVSVADKAGNTNIITVAWTGTICTNPPMLSISVRPNRFSHHMIMETGEFVVNLTTKELAYATDYCGVKSGREADKWKEMKLTPIPSEVVKAPGIGESPVNIECKVTEIKKLGSHDLFLAEVVAVHVDEHYMDDRGGFHLADAEPIVYCHGEYFDLGKKIGKFGYSVKKKT
ncbi:MAG: flavin reductase family protein [Lachnospiraceae bacterium]|nr:flavin reductase family protein [Lachnospiraceae bacterium]